MTFKKLADTPASLFALPIILGLTAFVVIRSSNNWQSATTFGIILVVCVIVLLFSGLFIMHNRLLLQWRMNWWRNLVLSGVFFIIGFLLLALLLRVDTTTDLPSYADALAQKLLFPAAPAPQPVLACDDSQDCPLPMEYALQSNCPFNALCVEGSCVVACPLYTPGPIGEGGYSFACTTDNDCDCAERGDRTLDCACLFNTCFSLEDYIAP